MSRIYLAPTDRHRDADDRYHRDALHVNTNDTVVVSRSCHMLAIAGCGGTGLVFASGRGIAKILLPHWREGDAAYQKKARGGDGRKTEGWGPSQSL